MRADDQSSHTLAAFDADLGEQDWRDVEVSSAVFRAVADVASWRVDVEAELLKYAPQSFVGAETFEELVRIANEGEQND